MATAAVRAPRGGVAPVTSQERRNKYILCILGALAFINPLGLYRLDFIKENLILQQWLGFGDFWQHNEVGASFLELAWWTLAVLPFKETLFGSALPVQMKWVLVIALSIGLMVIGYRFSRITWLSYRSYNRGWAIGTFFLKAAAVGGVVAIVMLGINFLFGFQYTLWNIIEIALWCLIVVLGAVVARGLCWNRDNRQDAGVGGVNVTMSDTVEVVEEDPRC